MGTKPVVSLILLALVGLVASAQAAAPTQAAAALPPDLMALEQKLLALHVSSERISGQERLVMVKGTAGHPKSSTKPVFVTLDAEVGLEPPRAAYSLSLGHAKLAERMIGDTEYRFESGLARLDGGRPWVREPRKGPEKTSSYLSRQRAKLIALINSGQSIAEVGAQTVDGQAVTEFTASVNPVAATSFAPFWIGIGEVSGAETMQLQLFLAPNGLPVSIRLTGNSEGTELSSREDLAINVPVVVHAPPARLTISKAQWKAIQQRLVARAEQRLKRRCKHPSKRDRRLCRIINRSPHRTSARPSPPRPPARTRAGK